jgi:hypothetical protein
LAIFFASDSDDIASTLLTYTYIERERERERESQYHSTHHTPHTTHHTPHLVFHLIHLFNRILPLKKKSVLKEGGDRKRR